MKRIPRKGGTQSKAILMHSGRGGRRHSIESTANAIHLSKHSRLIQSLKIKVVIRAFYYYSWFMLTVETWVLAHFVFRSQWHHSHCFNFHFDAMTGCSCCCLASKLNIKAYRNPLLRIATNIQEIMYWYGLLLAHAQHTQYCEARYDDDNTIPESPEGFKSNRKFPFRLPRATHNECIRTHLHKLRELRGNIVCSAIIVY